MIIHYLNQKAIPLLNGNRQKPIDLGIGNMSVSIGINGELHSINTYHAKQGFITLTAMEAFPNNKWYDSNYVRLYRKQLAGAESKEKNNYVFAVIPEQKVIEKETYYLEYNSPLFYYKLEDAEITSSYFAVERNGMNFLLNRLEISNTGNKSIILPIKFDSILNLTRSSFGQLTEAGPISVPPVENILKVINNRINIYNPNLPAAADISIYLNGKAFNLPEEILTSEKPVNYQGNGQINLDKEEKVHLDIVFTLNQSSQPIADLGSINIAEMFNLGIRELPKWNKKLFLQNEISNYIIARNLDYITSACSIPINNEHICVITDHQLLPLSWNRDSYYMIQLLLKSFENKEHLFEESYISVWEEKIKSIIRGHLLWMFEIAERPNNYWGRAYLTNGIYKDNVFQLDQQCYPLLELVYYYYLTYDGETVKRILPQVKEILNMLMDYKDQDNWLFKTGETPADDDVVYPYHFSSQILVWYTFAKLAELNKEFNFCDQDLSDWAAKVKKDAIFAFTTTLNGKELFAYLTDLQGNYQLYHDANDLPTVYAPLWDFCDKNDSKWLNTMEFAFTKDNKGGYYEGTYGGLGSVHTPHPWPLGDGQELLYSKITGNTKRRQAVLLKLEKLVQWDGLFSEAINENSGKVESRHWFSWPGAFISSVLLD